MFSKNVDCVLRIKLLVARICHSVIERRPAEYMPRMA